MQAQLYESSSSSATNAHATENLVHLRSNLEMSAQNVGHVDGRDALDTWVLEASDFEGESSADEAVEAADDREDPIVGAVDVVKAPGDDVPRGGPFGRRGGEGRRDQDDVVDEIDQVARVKLKKAAEDRHCAER